MAQLIEKMFSLLPVGGSSRLKMKVVLWEYIYIYIIRGNLHLDAVYHFKHSCD